MAQHRRLAARVRQLCVVPGEIHRCATYTVAHHIGVINAARSARQARATVRTHAIPTDSYRLLAPCSQRHQIARLGVGAILLMPIDV